MLQFKSYINVFWNIINNPSAHTTSSILSILPKSNFSNIDLPLTLGSLKLKNCRKQFHKLSKYRPYAIKQYRKITIP